MDPDAICTTFEDSLKLLDIDDAGLTPHDRMADLNAIACLCLDVKAITRNGHSPYELTLHRLAELTEDVLTTLVIPNKQAVRQWLVARSELMQLRITG